MPFYHRINPQATRWAEYLGTERLHTDNRPDLISIHVRVSGLDSGQDEVAGLVHAGVDAVGESVAGGVDGVDDGFEPLAGKADHVQHRTEHFSLQSRQSVQLEGDRGDDS